jgi:hypothetical protein
MNPAQRRIGNARSSLLFIVILSIVNIFAISGGSYFLFSAYLPQVFIALAVYGDPTLLMPMIVLSVIYVFPYLLCFIFSKKRKGWMVAALVLFLIDSAFFAIDVLPLLMLGDISFLFDAIIRVYALVTLIVGVTGYSKLEE